MSRIHGWLKTGSTQARSSPPSHARPARFVQAAPGAAHHVLAHRAAHPEQRRVEPVAPHRVDVRIAPVPAQNGERGGAQHIDHRAAAVAGIGQRRLLHELLPAPAGVQELRKEDELPFARDRRLVIELGVIPPARRIHRPRHGLQSGLTQRVTGQRALSNGGIPHHSNYLRQRRCFSIPAFRVSSKQRRHGPKGRAGSRVGGDRFAKPSPGVARSANERAFSQLRQGNV